MYCLLNKLFLLRNHTFRLYFITIIMFSLVYYYDGIFFVLNKNHVKIDGNKISAKYKDGIFYSCQLLYSHDDMNYLEAMKKQLMGGLLVNVENFGYFNDIGESNGSTSYNNNCYEKSECLPSTVNFPDGVGLPLTDDKYYSLTANKDSECPVSTDAEAQDYRPATEDDQDYRPETDNEFEDYQPEPDDELEEYRPDTDDEDQDYQPDTYDEDDMSSKDDEDYLPITRKNEVNSLCTNNIYDSISMEEKNEKLIFSNYDSEANENASENMEISMNNNPVGDAVKNSTTTIVKSSGCGTKKYSCKYCHKLVAKLVRHIETVHKDVDEVKKLSLISKVRREKNKTLGSSSKARLEMIKAIRAKGNFLHNVKCSPNSDFIPCRRPRKNKPPKTISTFAVCPHCKDSFSKPSLHKHFRKCSGQSSRLNRQVQCLSREVIGDIHEKAEPLLRKVVFRMRDDNITTVIRYDLLVILFGNLEAYKYRHSTHHGKMIRAKLRRLGRLLLELRKLKSNITDFSSLFDPSNFSTFLQAVNNLGNFNEENDLYDNPATAFALGTLTKELSDIWIADCIEKKNLEGKKFAEEFMHLYNLRFGKIVNKTVVESQTEMRIKKKIILPSLKDIQILHNYLVKKRTQALQNVKDKFNSKSWKDLLETTLTSVQLLNRRRAGEIERLKLVHYRSLEKIDEKSNFDLYKTLNINAKKIANKYSRILLRGKLNRTVPVLLNEEMVDCIQVILKFRDEAKVSKKNPYVFGIPGGVNNNEKWPSACDLMRKFSLQCNAHMPSSLRGTLLRKHVATCCISLNLTNGEIDDLSKFMGHDKNIHLNIYRQPIATKDILEISQLLEKAQGINEGKSVSEFNNDDCSKNTSGSHLISEQNVSMISEENEEETSRGTYEPETSQTFKTPQPYSKKRWDPESCAAVMNAFGENLYESKLPSSYDMQQLINNTPCLRNRTVPQLRTWLHTKRKIISCDEKDNSLKKVSQQRNRIPNTIYLLFASHISSKKIPTLQECYATYSKSPTLDKYNPTELQEFVKKAIEKNESNSNFRNNLSL